MVADTRPAVALTNAWTQIATGVTEVSITLEGNRAFPAVVRVAASAPPAGEATGHTLTALHRACPIGGLLPTQKVWARALNGSATIAIS